MKVILVLTIILFSNCFAIAQKIVKTKKDSSMLVNKFFVNLNPSYQSLNISANANTLNRTIREYNIGMETEAGVFVLKNIALGLKVSAAWYKSNYGNTEPSALTKGVFVRYYPTNFQGYKINTIIRKGATRGFIHPYLDFSAFMANFCRVLDTVNKIRTTFHNGRNDNLFFTTALGLQWNSLRRVGVHLSWVFVFQNKSNTYLTTTKLTKFDFNTKGGVVFYFKKRVK